MVDAIVQRLAERVPELRLIDTAAAYAALEAPPARAQCPAAYVIELEETAGPQGLATGGTRQLVTERVAVVLILDAARDARGAAGAAALRPLRQAVRAALAGFAPDEAHDALTFQGGRLIAAEGGYLAWEEAFAARSVLRGPDA